MKKITDYNDRNSTKHESSELVRKYWIESGEKGQTMAEFLEQFDWESAAELTRGVQALTLAVCRDKHFQHLTTEKKGSEDYDSDRILFYNRHFKLASDFSHFEKSLKAVADSIWEGGYARARMHDRIVGMFHVEQSAERYNVAKDAIMQIYGLTEKDIEKIRFFVEMTKAEDNFPPSLRRMLYIWSEKKKTGKSTVARVLVSLLNGEEYSETTAAKYQSNLRQELQIGDFKLPLIASCNCVQMDECFFADMGKVYADFKNHITSTGGKARLPYGQTFSWHGNPNYIATSNDPLSNFIKDWNDRRFLSVEFHAPTSQLTFEQIADLWRDFVVSSTPEEGWSEWAAAMYEDTMEKGEYQQEADDLELEMRKTAFLAKICERADPGTNANDNRYSLKNIKRDLEAVGALTVADISGNKMNGRVRKAMTQIFGECRKGASDWRLTDVKKKANELMLGNDEKKQEGAASDLPF